MATCSDPGRDLPRLRGPSGPERPRGRVRRLRHEDFGANRATAHHRRGGAEEGDPQGPVELPLQKTRKRPSSCHWWSKCKSGTTPPGTSRHQGRGTGLPRLPDKGPGSRHRPPSQPRYRYTHRAAPPALPVERKTVDSPLATAKLPSVTARSHYAGGPLVVRFSAVPQGVADGRPRETEHDPPPEVAQCPMPHQA